MMTQRFGGFAKFLVAVACLTTMGGSGAAFTQDTRTVTEPVFPLSCTVLPAQTAMAGAGPASETLDTARIQAALTACAAGKAVELTSSGNNYAFVSGPLNIPSGVGLIVDGGVTLFASRNREDFQNGTVSSSQEECGTQGTNANGCRTMFTFNNGGTNANSGIYGYGVIDGRGYATTLKGGVDTGISWWQNADNIPSGSAQNNPIMMKFSKSTNFTLYKITLRNSPMFHVGWAGTGFTAWGVKIQAPFTAHNTDGIDPDGMNVTITNASISDGDDNVAVGASSPASNITVSNTTTYSGHGISVGSYTQGGLQNFLVTNVNMAGTAADGNGTGIRLKSAADRGGLLNNITYRNMCIRDIRHPLLLTPFYNANSGTLLPQFSNVLLQNVHFLSPTLTGLNYLISVQGRDASHQTTITFDNVVFDSLSASNVSPAPQYTSFTLGPGPVYPSFLQSLTGTGVTYTGSAPATQTGAYACNPATAFPYIVGELYASTATATNLQAANVTGIFTLNAMLQPAMSTTSYSGTVGNYSGAQAPARPVNFLEGATVVGTGTLSANGTLASLPITNATAGTHTYTAQYPGDTNYGPITFGSVTLTVSGASAAATSTTLAAAPASGAYGSTTTLVATVAPGGTPAPSGQITFRDGSVTLATVPISGATATTTQVLGGGGHALTAAYSGDSNFLTSTSTAATVAITTATPAASIAAAPASIAQGASAALTVTLTRATGGANPTGTVSLLDGTFAAGSGPVNSAGVATLTVTPTTVGTHSYTATYNGDANYTTATTSATVVTVTSASASTVLTVTPATAGYGAAQTLTASVTGSGTAFPTGTVKFMDGVSVLATSTLSGGGLSQLVTQTATLSGGSHTITAVYGGDAVYGSSTSLAVATIVTPAAPAVVFTATPAAVASGANVTLLMVVTPVAGGVTPTGSVKFSDGATQYGTGTLDGTGKASIAFLSLVGGAHPLVAQYLGDANYAGATSAVSTVTVTSGTYSVTLSLSPATIYQGGPETLTATVTATSGTPTGSVNFFAGGTSLLGAAAVNGSGIATLNLPTTVVGTQTITAAYVVNSSTLTTSAPQTLTIVLPFTLSAAPTMVTLGPGKSGSVALNVMGAGGYAATVGLGCTSPVGYINCIITPATINVAGASAVASNATISVTATYGALRGAPFEPRAGVWLAIFLPIGLLGLVRRRTLLGRALLMILLAVGLAGGVAGCGTSASVSPAAKSPPTGTQTVLITAAGGTIGGVTSSQSVSISVVVTN